MNSTLDLSRLALVATRKKCRKDPLTAFSETKLGAWLLGIILAVMVVGFGIAVHHQNRHLAYVEKSMQTQRIVHAWDCNHKPISLDDLEKHYVYDGVTWVP
jgi:hypothetical protein